ncbi:MAG: rhodanese-like domain-containing protein [Gemmatimonadales bacterium]
MTFDPPEDEGSEGRWKRHREEESSSNGLRIFAIVVVALLLILAGVAFFAGRPIAFSVIQRKTAGKFPEIRWVKSAELASWRADSLRQQPVVLDARTETEFDVSHLPDATRIDPYRPLLRPLKGLPESVPIAVYSSVGYRGARVAHWLAAQGYTNVQNLQGGIFSWANDDHPLVRQGGPTTEVHPYQPRWGFLLESGHRIDAPALEKRSAAP